MQDFQALESLLRDQRQMINHSHAKTESSVTEVLRDQKHRLESQNKLLMSDLEELQNDIKNLLQKNEVIHSHATVTLVLLTHVWDKRVLLPP